MYNEDYLYDELVRKTASLHRQVDDLKGENSDLERQLREKESRIRELEDALESMRRELRYVEDGHHLDKAKQHGKTAISGFW